MDAVGQVELVADMAATPEASVPADILRVKFLKSPASTTAFASERRKRSMTSEAPLPVLPVYEKPRNRVPATIPAGMEMQKMPGVMNKILTRALPKPKLGKRTKGAVRTGRAGKFRGIRIASGVKIKSKLSKEGKETE